MGYLFAMNRQLSFGALASIFDVFLNIRRAYYDEQGGGIIEQYGLTS